MMPSKVISVFGNHCRNSNFYDVWIRRLGSYVDKSDVGDWDTSEAY
jgi:hypothetical protein